MIQNSIYDNVLTQLKIAVDKSDIIKWDKNFLEIISHHDRVFMFDIPVNMDNWEIKIFQWYRAQHNNAKWPYKWWIRFHQDVSLDEVKSLSAWMSLKTSVLWLPLWGGKWWIIVNPKKLSEIELENLSRWYVRWIYKYLWPDVDVPAPDVNTSPKIMAWMVDEYSKLVWKQTPGAFTWKPLSVWWSLVRETSTGLWWFYVLETYLNSVWKNIKDISVIIQWAWNVSLWIARYLDEKGARIVWISDSKCWIYKNDWLDVQKIISLKKNNESLSNYNGADIIRWEDILYKYADVLIPAALENQITKNNVNKISAWIILELANWPVSFEADEILFQKWIPVIPDILANAWWVTVSYFEQVQNSINYYWSEEEIKEKLYQKMLFATQEVIKISNKYSVNLRTGAYIIALERIYQAMKDLHRI